MCTSGGACWEHPLPQGGTLRSAWHAGGRRAWLAGDHGAILEWTGERTVYSNVPSLFGSQLLSIHGATPNEAFAAGTGGLLLAWDGRAWSAEQMQFYTGNFSAVAAMGDGGAVAVGPNGVVAWRNASQPPGARWLRDTSFSVSVDLTAVAAHEDGVFVAASGSNTVFRATGAISGWMRESLPLPGGVSDLAAGGRLYALQDSLPDGGLGSSIVARTGAGWELFAELPGRASAIRAAPQTLWAAGPSGLWVVGLDGGLVSAHQGSMPNWNALAPLSDTAAVLGGAGGAMAFAFADGGLREHSVNNNQQRLGKLCALPSGGVPWLVATSASPAPATCTGSSCFARLMERQLTAAGAQWLVVDVPTPSGGMDTLSCHLDSAQMGWATTSRRWQLRRIPGGWTSFDLGGSADNAWYGVWGPPGGPWDFVGNNQDTVRTDGVTAGIRNGRGPGYRALAGVAPSSAFAVGPGGVVGQLRLDGTFRDVNGPSTADMQGLGARSFAGGGSLYVAVGRGGAVWTARNGNPFISVPGFTSADLRDVWVSPTGDSWLVGNSSRVQLFPSDGGRASVEAPVAGLNGVVGWRDADGGRTQLWVTGDNGAVLTITR